jgi:hypothetical protein
VRDLIQLYGISDHEGQQLLTLAAQARAPGWWMQYYDGTLGQYVGLEQDAAHITSFSRYSVPELLQTREYARAIYEKNQRSDDIENETRAEATIRRQAILVEPPTPRYTAFLDEAVLYRRVGDTDTMRGQLVKLLEVAERPNVALHVLPFAAGFYSFVESNFHLLEFRDPDQEPPLLFIEGSFGSVIKNRSSELIILNQALMGLEAVTLTVGASATLINKLMSFYGR